MAAEVNFVWNFCNEAAIRALRERNTWFTENDLRALTKGFSKCEGVLIGSTTVQSICSFYVSKRLQFKKAKLRWRVSNPTSSKRSLGWIPFGTGAVKYRAGQVVYNRHKFNFWDSYGLGSYDLRSGNFSQDSRGRWYLNVCVEDKPVKSAGVGLVGIDLGLKTAAVCSDGSALESGIYRRYEPVISLAQRAHKKDRVRALNAKIKNTRKDALHKFSTRLVAENAAIFVGDVSTKSMIKLGHAKSVYDAGWAKLKIMLEYKSHRAGIIFEEVNEAYTTQTCSCCGSIPASSPKGRAGLRIRRWTCGDCGAEHDRDVNAAKNIAARGQARLAGGSSQ